MKYHSKYGNKWTRISKLIGGRTDNAVKNRYHALCLKKKAKYLSRFDSGDTVTLSIPCLLRCRLRIRHIAALEGVSISVALWRNTELLKDKSIESKWRKFRSKAKPCIRQDSAMGIGLMVSIRSIAIIMIPKHMWLLIWRFKRSWHQLKMPIRLSQPPKTRCSLRCPINQNVRPLRRACLFCVLGFSNIYEGNLVSPFYNCQAFSSLQQRPIEPSFNNRRQELTLDLSFQQGHEGIDFDSLLNSLSPPLSTKQYWNYLCSLSPVDFQPSFVSDHDARMNAWSCPQDISASQDVFYFIHSDVNGSCSAG